MARADQRELFPAQPTLPEGFAYRAEFITPDEERALLEHLEAVPFAPFQFHGHEGLRRVFSFGWRYEFNGLGLVQAPPIPAWLLPLRERAAALAGLAPEALAHVLLTEYREGAPIGWHRDRPAFDRVVGVSLRAACVLRLRRRVGARFERRNVSLEARSAYLLAGPARTEWEHSIAEAEALRYSVTFRNLR